jgi:hypothetical protein
MQKEKAPLSVVYAAPSHFPTWMMPNGPPAKLVAFNETQANAASNTRKMFDLAKSSPAQQGVMPSWVVRSNSCDVANSQAIDNERDSHRL